ncbi:MAG: DUF134 domain-containing protein [Bacillota bacterium]|nr:DUF134 domain-containing protein [Bacillota bacterium]
MPRPPRCRRICDEPKIDTFCPDRNVAGEPVLLTLDEYEAIRLVDLQGQTHEQCALQMDISRSTVQEIYESARRKIAACIVHGRSLKITGGNYRLCHGREHVHCGGSCRKKEQIEHGGEHIMKIAVTYEDGEIFQHFGHTEKFKIYDVTDNRISGEEVVDTNGSGHGALAGFLMQQGVEILICGGIGGGAQMALAEAGIRLYGGVSGKADDAVNALLNGKLGYNASVRCDHHGHREGGHNCGEHSCGNHGCH